MPLRRQTEGAQTSRAEFDKIGSTNSAVGYTAQDVLHLTRSQLRVNRLDGRKATEGPVGVFEPTHGTLVVAKVFTRDRYNASQSVKPVGLITCQPSTTAPALQASR